MKPDRIQIEIDVSPLSLIEAEQMFRALLSVDMGILLGRARLALMEDGE